MLLYIYKFWNIIIIIITLIMIFRPLSNSAFALLKTSSLLTKIPKFSFSQLKQSNLETPQKTSSVIAKNIGMTSFLNKTYLTSGLAFSGALASSYWAAKTGLMAVSPFVGIGMMLVGIIGASYMKPIQANENFDGNTIYKTKNSIPRILLYTMGIAGMGLSAAPLLSFAHVVSPSIIPNALAVSTGIFGGASMIAYTMPKDKMLGYGRLLTGSLLGLIGVQLLGLLSTFIVGPNPFASFLFSVDSYISVALFTGFVAYDTHVAIKSYEQGNADHLGLSIQFLLDFWNIFISLVRIFIQNKN